ncbi:pleckstrin homology domain-containing family O member 1-like isoform X2 [Brienomyrus brachyistius]|uniref:pleckstrin homology domain-containing family O member 1-like isoform X2 n=1 Tax=Brienomyrus brachyistius TaxID=42636 RepID=UPI0020B31E08|nr:pleckstrin homology domain-containing family O member 1-like isoform X2 [Brienomyrus brachyistius]
MKKNNSAKRGPQDPTQPSSQPDKIGWIRKFCGKGIFREIWRNRFVVLKGEQLYISEKEVKDERKIQEVFDLTDYERSEELRKSKSRSKKNHSKFTVLRCHQPGNTVPNLVFLAVSPEEKESWINALNVAITRAKNRILDEVTVEEENLLLHPTRDRAKIPHTRRLPTRGHIMAVEEDISAPIQSEQGEKNLKVDLDESAPQPDSVCQQTNTESAKSPVNNVAVGKGQGLPQKSKITWDEQQSTGQVHSPEPGEKRTPAEKSRCVSMNEISSSDLRAVKGATAISPGATSPLTISQLQDLISKKLQKTQELLAEVRGKQQRRDKDASNEKRLESRHAEAERLLQEAVTAWSHARDVLEEVRQIQALSQQLNSTAVSNLTLSQNGKQKIQATKGRV